MPEQGNFKVAFWVMTSVMTIGLLGLAGSSLKGYLILDSKIANAEDTLKQDKEKDIVRIERRIEKVEERVDKATEKLERKIDKSVDKVRSEYKEFRMEQQMVNVSILDKLDDLKKSVE